MTRPPIRISASRLKTLNHCSLSFYYQDVLRLPSRTHHKTLQGSAIHRIIELIMKPKRLALFKRLLIEGVDTVAQPALERFIRIYDHYHGISPYEMSAMLDMVRVAFLGMRPHFVDAAGAWSPPTRGWVNEKRFQLQVGDATISGFIDLLLQWDDHVVLQDFKSQKAKFPQAELPSNVQALIYQRAVHQEMGMVPAVEFLMLRHAPTKRHPSLHLQRVEAHSLPVLDGLGAYVEDTYRTVNGLTLEQASRGTLAEEGFCIRVCPYLKPFSYLALIKRDDTTRTPIKTFLLDSPPKVVQDDEMLVELRHRGCAVRG